MPRFSFGRNAGGDDANDFDDDAAGTDRVPSGRRRSRRWIVLAIAGCLLLAIAFGCWLGFQAFRAKSNLQDARVSAQMAKEALLSGDASGAAKWAGKANAEAEKARAATASIPWRMVSDVPWLGSPFRTGQEISNVVAAVVTDILQPSVQVAKAVSPDHLLANGRADVQLLREAAPKLSEISAAATKVDAQARMISQPSYLSVMADARSQVQAQTAAVSRMVEYSALAARIAPAMMGADGPRTYFLGFQTNAEARGTGGLVGQFGILRFDNGKPTVEHMGSDSELTNPYRPIDLGPDYAQQYGFADPTTDVRNSNLSSHFPYAGQIWQSMWEQQSGAKVDGAIAIDPVALSYILGAIGPVKLPTGDTVTKDNVVELTEATAYSRFGEDREGRKGFLQAIADEIAKKMTGPVVLPRQLLEALGRGISERRIAVWSSTPAEQEVLEQTALAHTVPDDPSPYAAVVVNNIAGNKLDYYLDTQIEYSADACEGDTRKSVVTVRLTNNVPISGIPGYVGGAEGLPIKLPDFTNAASVSLLATKNAELKNATIDGHKATIFVGAERGHPLYEAQLMIQPGRTVELKYELDEPTTPGAPSAPSQPMRKTVVPVVNVPECHR